jgi:hypothetical protein
MPNLKQSKVEDKKIQIIQQYYNFENVAETLSVTILVATIMFCGTALTYFCNNATYFYWSLFCCFLYWVLS